MFYERDRAYRLRESEVHTLSDLGKFRVIATEDLATHAYQDHREEMEHDIRNLVQQGLSGKRHLKDRKRAVARC